MKTYYYPALLLLLAVAAFFAMRSRSNQTMQAADTQFAFKDTAAISKIRILDRDGRTATIVRQTNNKWRVNDRVTARKDGIDNLLSVIYKVFVIKPVPNSAYENALKSCTNPAKTVEIYTDNPNQVAHKYYIGAAAPNQSGTYMLLDGSQRPHIVGIPAFEGYLLQNYFTPEEQWRSRTVFDYAPDQVAWIKADYKTEPQQSFLLTVNDNAKNDYTIEPLDPKFKSKGIIQGASVDSLLWSLSNKEIESYANDYPKLDSLEKAQPYCRYTVAGKDGQTHTMIIFLAPITRRAKQQADSNGKPLQFDNERYFAFVNQGRDLAIMQRYVFDNVLKKYSDLVK